MENEKIAQRYEKRNSDERVIRNQRNVTYNQFIRQEREAKLEKILRHKFQDFNNLALLEIGAGNGCNLPFFQKMGMGWHNIYANELLPERYEELVASFPKIHTLPGDACDISAEYDHFFDIVFQSTVFTSILDHEPKKRLADRLWSLTKPGGFLLWYDFTFDNPRNSDVKGIKVDEIKNLFPESSYITFHKVTLAPPIGRRVKKLYKLFNLMPFLRTHVIAVIQK